MPERLLRRSTSTVRSRRPSAVKGKSAASQRRGGRLTEQRYKEIMHHAAQLFLDRGYEQVTIDDIVAAVGGSKRTLYDRFGGKAGLFEAVIKDYCSAEHRSLLTGVDPKSTIDQQLAKIGTNFLTMIFDKQTLELHRLMVSMGRSFPSVGQAFFRAGPESAYRIVGDWIKQFQSQGKLVSGHPERLASLYLDMLTGNLQLALLTSSLTTPIPKAISETVNAAVPIFLRGLKTK